MTTPRRPRQTSRSTPSRTPVSPPPVKQAVVLPLVSLSKLILESNKDTEAQQDIPPLKGLSFLDRFLVVWIILAMAVGILLGNFVPSTGPALQQSTFVGVSVPIAVGLLVMMYPILCKVRFETVSFEFLWGRGQIPRLSHTYTHPH